MSKYQPVDPANPDHLSAIVSIWNAACGPELSISPRFVSFNLQPSTGAVLAGQVAIDRGTVVGFVLCSALPGDPATSPPELGWLDAIAVLPQAQHQGIGSELLAWAEHWLQDQGCSQMRLGGSLRPYVAGYPVELGNHAFFHRRGFQARAGGEFVWDVARVLGESMIEAFRADVSAMPIIRPAQSGEENALLDFFRREFPGRWRFEFEESLHHGERISDWVVVLSDRRIDGFAHLTFENSVQPLGRVFPQRLPRPWGQLGPIGVARDLRGQDYGRALLEAGLAHLYARGVRGCIIDWTGLLDFYAKFGFKPYRQYAVLLKPLDSAGRDFDKRA